MTFAPTSSKPPAISKTLMRQIKSGKTESSKAEVVATGRVYSSGSAIDLSDEHPAQTAAATVLPQKESPLPKQSRFGAIGDCAIALAKESSETAEQAEKAGRFDKLIDPSKTPLAQQSKMNMAAAKALTPLVAAISFNPGSRSESALKSKALAELVCQVQEATTDIALAVAPTFASNDWARGQLMVALSSVAARQWEKHGFVDLKDIGRCMSGAFRSPSPELLSALESFEGSDKYAEANDEETAKARLSVTVCSAAWEINDWVTHSMLRLSTEAVENDPLPMPSRVFSYGLPVADIVESLLSKIIDESRGFELQVKSADLRLSHLQGAVRRMSQIAGAEYVTQTSAIHEWIKEAASEEEKTLRQNLAHEQFHTHVLPRVMEWTRMNYAAVESKAQKILNANNQGFQNDEKQRHAS
jgi:hypothetical protein